MKLPIRPPYPPMEARSADAIPRGDGWQFEPKWDGFRCLIFRDGDEVELQSKALKPLGRYFPEVVEAARAIPAKRFVLDTELLVPIGDVLSFDDLLQRIHPAESRVKKLAAETPALVVVFDLLVDENGDAWVDRPLVERRAALEAFAAKRLKGEDVRLSPATTERKQAETWLSGSGAALDGVIAKRLDRPYASGERTAVVKVKRERTADCVVGGFRYGTGSKDVGSLLLGLYDEDGLLHHVGFTSGFKGIDKKELTARLEGLKGKGFTGNAPGGPSRWATERSVEWVPLDPSLVVEVAYDHFTGDRFRHGTRLVRWRPDKAPEDCTMDQVKSAGARYRKILG